ncbi:hypothetical protein Cri9333_4012 [Crinalium epipsammum PCC 9333]|uniref:Uncharacterized protein n=1 Tax=Crinalium epipsammum PCC 9333 TaxID=1173022 RepID=K9W4U9_9CYAN|nr:COP23 domain-containing protein [Crinalium epipsammum]AFZ14819.1 hypothetical protein Cri9333_4012 [Crinalium epipsammum PCC 9333]
MKRTLITTLALTLTTTIITAAFINSNSHQVKAESTVQFLCRSSYDEDQGTRLPTTLAWTSRGKIAVIRWVKELGGKSPQERCEKISPRFQEAYQKGTLSLITNGRINNQPVICTAKEYGGKCETLLMTLRPGDNSLQMLNSLVETLNGRGVGPIKHSSGVPQVYYQVYIDDFLQTAPVEKE